MFTHSTISVIDPELSVAIRAENQRQEDHIELIASENYTSPAVMEAQGSRLNLRPKQLMGRDAEAVLGRAHITCNKNGIPNDPQKPMITSGIRLGSPAMTTRGFKVQGSIITANLIADVLDHPQDEDNLARVRAQVATLTRRYPVYAHATK